MKLFTQQEVLIDGLDEQGRGVSSMQGKTLLIPDTLPGERVRIRLLRRDKGVYEGALEEILEASPERITPRCPFAGRCGGCSLQHASYAHQLRMKEQLLQEAFTKAGIKMPPYEIEGAKEIWYYRNRMDYVFGKDGELGLKERGKWWAPLDLDTCYLLSPETPEILHRVRDWTKKSGLPFWNAKTQKGFFRYLVIREGKRTGERLVLLVTGPEIREDTKELIGTLPEALDGLTTSVLWGVNPLITDISIPQTLTTLQGNPWLSESVGGITFRITPASFFQTNTVMAERLQEIVVEACGDTVGKTILDLFCGAGFFTLALGKQGASVIGVESDLHSVEAARANAELNAIPAIFHALKAEAFLWESLSPDIVIVDPPRAGLHPAVIKSILRAAPQRLIYVSCKYSRFLEELPLFLPHYDLTSLKAVDLFPHTAHVEIVATLEKRQKST